MKLRQKSKRDQALDAVASMAKTWSEWRLGEKVSKTAAKSAKKAGTAARSAKKSRASSGGGKKRSPVKIAGAIALLGGVGAAVAKKLSRGKAEPLYTPPAPAADPVPPVASPVVSEGLTQPPTVNEPIAPSPGAAGPAATEPSAPGPRPVSIEDVAGNVAAAEGAAETPLGAEDAGVVPASQQAAPSQEHAPEPEDLISDKAEPEAAAGDDDAAAVDEATERP